MPTNPATSKNLIALITGILMLACSLTACLGFASILIPPAADSLSTSVLFFAIFLIIAAVVLLLVGVGLFVYFGPRTRQDWLASREEKE